MLRDQINAAVKDAMKARDQRRVSALRLINSAIQKADLDAGGLGKPALTDVEILALLQKMIAQRQESAEIYEKAGRTELAAQERGEIEVIKGFLPQQMSEAEVKAAITDAIKQTGAASVKDMGKVMAALKERYAGRMDFGKASGAVKGMLG